MNVGESTGPLLLAIVAAGRRRGGDRRDDVLRPHQRRLPRRHHARRHADPVQVHERDRRRRLPDRQRRGSAASTASRRSRPSTCPAIRTSRDLRHAVLLRRHRRAPAAAYLLVPLDPRAPLRPNADRHPRERGRASSCSATARRLYKTAIFTVSAAMAGLAGCLFANWAEIVTPGVFSLGQSAEVMIWIDRRRPRHADRPDRSPRSCSARLKLAARPADH